jgi:hypothetical protein
MVRSFVGTGGAVGDGVGVAAPTGGVGPDVFGVAFGVVAGVAFGVAA